MQLDEQFIEVIKHPIFTVWDQIAQDCTFVDSNLEAIEMCVDADRLEMHGGSSEANKLLKDMCCEHGYENVLAYLEKYLQVY